MKEAIDAELNLLACEDYDYTELFVNDAHPINYDQEHLFVTDSEPIAFDSLAHDQNILNLVENFYSILKDFNSKEEVKEFLDNIKNKNKKTYTEEDFLISNAVEDYKKSFNIFFNAAHVFDNNPFWVKKRMFSNRSQYEADYYFFFTFLKVLDSALKYSKINPSGNDEKNLIYPNGEELGFYNTSKWDLESLILEHIFNDPNDEISLRSNLQEYISGFPSYTNIVLSDLGHITTLFLELNNLLLFFIIGIHLADLNEKVFLNSKNLQEFYLSFLQDIREGPIFKSPNSYTNSFPERPDFSSSILPQLLLSRVDIKEKEEISIFDPFCEEGDLLLECFKYIKKINPNCKVKLYGNCINRKAYALCLSKFTLHKIDIRLRMKGDYLDQLFENKEFEDMKFDFVISDFSFLEYKEPYLFKGRGFEFSELAALCKNKLVLMGSSTFYQNKMRYPINTAIDNDFLEAVIRLPIETAYNKDYIFIFNFDKTPKTQGKFLSIDEFEDSRLYPPKEIPSKILSRMIKYYKSFKGYEKGKIISNPEYSDFKDYLISFKILMLDKKFNFENSGVPTFHLKDLVDIYTGRSDNGKGFDFYYLNDSSNQDKNIYYSDFDGSDKVLKEMIAFKLKSNKVSKEYLYYFLNSNKGQHIISYITSDWVYASDFGYIPVPVPSIEEQKNIVDVARDMDEFFNAMDIWKNDYSNNILNYKATLQSYKEFTCDTEFRDDGRYNNLCRNWRIVYQGLAWPLAYSYLKATKGSQNDSIKKNNYLVLFEFLAAFNVIVLISGLKNYLANEEDYNEIRDYLWQLYYNDKKTWRRMAFGGWTTLYGRLTNVYKEHDISAAFDKNFLFDLSQKKYKKLFNKLRDKERNLDAHGGLEDDIDIKLKMDDLEGYMSEDIFDIFKIYSGLKFYYVTSDNKDISPKKTSYTVLSLNGPCDNPHYHQLITDKKLEPYCLYFYNTLNDEFLKLDNDLIKFRVLEDTKQYGIYIYNGIDTKKGVAIYKALHLKNETWEIPLKTDEDTYFKVSDEFLKHVLRLDLDE